MTGGIASWQMLVRPSLTARLLEMGQNARINLGFARAATMSQGIAPGTRFCSGRSNPAYTVGSNEVAVQQALEQNIAPGGVFFDVGANVGYLATLLARAVPNLRVFAFEPLPGNAAVCRLNFRLNALRNADVVEKAVGEVSGRARLLKARYSGGSTLESVGIPPDLVGVTQVDVVSLDDCVARWGLPVPTLVKIDVEGAEIQVLRGMRSLLQSARPCIVYEIDGPDVATVQSRKKLCDDFMTSAGYRLFELADSYADIRWHVRHTLAKPV